MYTYSLNILFELIILLLILILLIAIASIFIIRHLRKEYKKVFRIQSRFDIELRKMVNIMHKFLQIKELEQYHKLVIKKLSHDEKRELIQIIEKAYANIDLDKEENAYVIETFSRLEEIRRNRDSKVIVYNDKLALFPFNIYAKILKYDKYKVYTTK
ncbi:MAG: hypothetical protein K9L64_02150 [Candidatus Izimaplasma sp.]|nr:hypothetical protein [Candidatus Izimaplasma bacterium]